MAIKLKFSESASAGVMAEALDTLAQSGLPARRLFPRQERPSLATIYAIDSGNARLAAVRKLLGHYLARGEIEFVEGSPDRRPTAG